MYDIMYGKVGIIAPHSEPEVNWAPALQDDQLQFLDHLDLEHLHNSKISYPVPRAISLDRRLDR
jgi:hypothetical protein